MKICGKCGHRHFKKPDDGKCHCGELVFQKHKVGMVPHSSSWGSGRKFDSNFQFYIDQNH